MLNVTAIYCGWASGNRWPKAILNGWPEGRKRSKFRNEVGKGSDKSDEAEESNRQRRIIAHRE